MSAFEAIEVLAPEHVEEFERHVLGELSTLRALHTELRLALSEAAGAEQQIGVEVGGTGLDVWPLREERLEGARRNSLAALQSFWADLDRSRVRTFVRRPERAPSRVGPGFATGGFRDA